MSIFSLNMQTVLPTRAFPVIAVLTLIFFHVETAAAQPRPDPLSGDSVSRPPSNSQLAFVRDQQIYVVNVDGTGLIQLTDTEPDVANSDPAWSPDGRTITFTSDWRAYDFVYDLYAMDADGSDVCPILQGPFFWPGATFYYQSAWSPDGQSIAVVRCADAFEICWPDSDIAIANADGSELRVIAHGGGYASPSWSPDGHWIAYASLTCRSCEPYIRYVQVDGDIEGLIVENGHSPSWRPPSGANVNVGHSGAWFNPATSGQGQFLDIEPDKQFVFLGWFTHTDDSAEFPNQQHWFTAEGHYVDNRAELVLYESLGGGFNQAQPVVTTPVGEVTLTFSDCGQCTMRYRFDDRNLEGGFPMVRAIPGSGNGCESSTESTTQAVSVNDGMDGAWSNPGASGQGFFFDVHAGDDGTNFIFVSWFSYGDGTASGQRWLTAEGRFAGSKANLVIYDTSGGSFDDSRPTESVHVGTMRIDFSDCSHAVLSYSMPEEGSGGTIEIRRTVPGSQALCEELNTLQ